MPEKLPANTPWKYDYVPHYNLDERIVNDFLKSIWGNYKYFVEVSHLLRQERYSGLRLTPYSVQATTSDSGYLASFIR